MGDFATVSSILNNFLLTTGDLGDIGDLETYRIIFGLVFLLVLLGLVYLSVLFGLVYFSGLDRCRG